MCVDSDHHKESPASGALKRQMLVGGLLIVSGLTLAALFGDTPPAEASVVALAAETAIPTIGAGDLLPAVIRHDYAPGDTPRFAGDSFALVPPVVDTADSEYFYVLGPTAGSAAGHEIYKFKRIPHSPADYPPGTLLHTAPAPYNFDVFRYFKESK